MVQPPSTSYKAMDQTRTCRNSTSLNTPQTILKKAITPVLANTMELGTSQIFDRAYTTAGVWMSLIIHQWGKQLQTNQTAIH